MNDMTPAQGKFVTSLLNDLTAASPTVGAEARARLHAMHAADALDKRAASHAIDVLKSAIAMVREGGNPAPALTHALATRTPATPARTHRSSRQMVVEPSDREQRMLARLGAHGATPVTDSVRQAVGNVRQAKATVGAQMAPGFDIRRAMRNWTPGNAATREEVGF